jgi:protein SCO1/2
VPRRIRRAGVVPRALVLGALFALAPFGRGIASDDGRPLAPDFTLTDERGARFTLSHQRGRPVVLFFGYAHCPDVCPTLLANVARALKTIGPAALPVEVALVTVDPARDDAATLRRFVTTFDPAFHGLTGTPAALKPVYRAYHVRYAKGAGASGDYLVSHTAFVYYVGRDGRIRSIGTWSDSQEVLTEDLRGIVNR